MKDPVPPIIQPTVERQESKREDNPFEDEVVAKAWINSVEGEQGMVRDKEIYPLLKTWVTEVQPDTLIEIGSGQGICSEKIGDQKGKYVGVEPSLPLVNRAKEMYQHPNRDFVVGNAYALPVGDATADAVFSVNVWFHLENLPKASQELARVLRPGGHFLIVTANPAEDRTWEEWFSDYTKQGKVLDGKVRVPNNVLGRSVIYQHSMEEMQRALEESGLQVNQAEPFGVFEKDGEQRMIFIRIKGHKAVEVEL